MRLISEPKQRVRGLGLLGRVVKSWESEGEKCIVSKECLIIQIRVSQVMRVVSESSSFPGKGTFLHRKFIL